MRKLWAIFKISIRERTAEQGAILVWALTSALGIITIIFIWLASDRDIIGGYTKSELVTYYLMVYVLEQFVYWMIYWDISDAIASGTLANYLLKPISYIKSLAAREAGSRVISLTIQLGVGVLLIWSFGSHVTLSASATTILKTLVTVPFAILLMFLLHGIMATFVFYLTDASFIDAFFWVAYPLLSGKILPLSMFPPIFQNILNLLPFRYMNSFTLEVLFEKISTTQYITGLATALAWVLILGLAFNFTWKRGLKAYGAYGR